MDNRTEVPAKAPIEVSRRTFLKVTVASLAGLVLHPVLKAGNDTIGKVNATVTPTTSTPIPKEESTPTPRTLTTKDVAPTTRHTPEINMSRELFLEGPVNTPPSLMLHSKDLPQLADLLPLIVNSGYNATTYEQYYQLLLRGEKPNSPFLITIDDLGITYLNPAFKRIIEAIDNAGMVGTLGVVTSGERMETKGDIWEYLKKIQEKGWELAIHTENLVLLPSLSDTNLLYQIKEPYEEIFEAIGKPPVTLILPYGGVINNSSREIDRRIFDVCKKLGIRWVVGIQGGKEFVGSSPYFAGRVPPGETAQITMVYLENSFGNK